MNIDALTLSTDQAFFFPKASRLALLDKLDNDPGTRIMLEPFFDAVLQFASKSTNIIKFSFSSQSIGHQVGMSRLIFHDIVKYR